MNNLLKRLPKLTAHRHLQDNGLTSSELGIICQNSILSHVTITSKDRLIDYCNKKEAGFYIVNLDDSTDPRGGTHWVALHMKNKKFFSYFDSYGAPPPVEIMRLCHSSLIYSTKQIQADNSTACGWFCLCFIIYFPLHDRDYQKFLNMFSTDLKLNDGILFTLLDSFGINHNLLQRSRRHPTNALFCF